MMTFYDKNGYAVCYTMDNIHLYSFDGYPLAYFHAEKVWSYNGCCLGWLHNNWIIDVNGFYVFFSEYATGGMLKPLRHLKPLKSLRRLRPLKSLRHFAPLKPLVKSQWSSLSFEEFFGIS